MTARPHFQSLWARANQAGLEAGRKVVPETMYAIESNLLTGQPKPGARIYAVPEGPCGFAWVQLKPGTSAFAKWLKANRLAHADSYHGGVSIDAPMEFGQSITRKEAWAGAVARVFNEVGLRAYPMSRLD